MSDLAFLRERARQVRAEVWFADDKLHFKSRDKRTATTARGQTANGRACRAAAKCCAADFAEACWQARALGLSQKNWARRCRRALGYGLVRIS